ncbi:MAG: hypothetical protein CMC76_08815 [Flavobacteriaceae bacterium]|nr:hypothetical protein [Flavobacteriaceae bacterium]|tara:strand:- start:236 stop:913 length:678 start_codon:yes stop_codon:yes gene_type:complete
MTYQKLKTTISVILLILIQNIYSQNMDFASEQGLIARSRSRIVDAEGSPYVNDDFKMLKIDGFNVVFQGRYNAYYDEMEIKLSDDKIVSLGNNSEYVVTFNSDDKTYKTYNISNDKDISKRSFLVVLEETENYSILKKESVKFYSKIESRSSYQSEIPAKFKREDDQYFVKYDNKVVSLPQKKKDFLDTFPEHSSKLKSYIKDNKLKLKHEEDLVKLTQYLITLK